MDHERDDYSLRVLIEKMQQQGSPEREIEAAVRSASRRSERQSTQHSQRPRPLGRLRRRLQATR